MSEEASARPHRVGHRVEDFCRPCKSQRAHTIELVGASGEPERVMCDTCGSRHFYRGGRAPASTAAKSVETPREKAPVSAPRVDREASETMSERHDESPGDLEATLRRILREEAGIPPSEPAEKWRGGELVMRPGKPGLQDKTMPIDVFFRKVVAVRNKLRVLEQQVNGADIPDDVKARLHGYITGCYGSLTSFNVLFAKDDDRFRGEGKG